MVRRLYGENVLFVLCGGRALLMQIAHPAVAAAVEQHSRFPQRRYRRLLDTLRLTLAIVYGTERQMQAAAGAVNAMHSRVRGPGYEAMDPRLLAWVLATMVDTGLQGYQLFLGPLSPAERQAYYQDMRRFGELLGIPAGYLPACVEEMIEYTRRTAASLQVSDAGRRLSREVFGGVVLLRPGMWLLRQVTAGLLPEPLRAQFGFGWGPRREALLQAFARLSRAVVPRLPRSLRSPPWFLMPDAWLPR